MLQNFENIIHKFSLVNTKNVYKTNVSISFQVTTTTLLCISSYMPQGVLPSDIPYCILVLLSPFYVYYLHQKQTKNRWNETSKLDRLKIVSWKFWHEICFNQNWNSRLIKRVGQSLLWLVWEPMSIWAIMYHYPCSLRQSPRSAVITPKYHVFEIFSLLI